MVLVAEWSKTYQIFCMITGSNPTRGKKSSKRTNNELSHFVVAFQFELGYGLEIVYVSEVYDDPEAAIGFGDCENWGDHFCEAGRNFLDKSGLYGVCDPFF